MATSDKEKEVSPIRLAFRQQGNVVNAFIAQTDTMNDAMLIGSISVYVVDKDKIAWEEFKKLMVGVLERELTDIGMKPLRMEERYVHKEKDAG